MQGKILDFNIKDGKGVIAGNDNNRYYFVVSEWESEKSPQANQNVDFDIEDNNARKIYILENKLDIDISSISKSSSKTIKSLQGIIGGTLSGGIANKTGFIVSAVSVVLTLLPFRPFGFDNVSLVSYSIFGKLLFLLFLALTFSFYTGVKKNYIKKLGLFAGLYGSFYSFYSLITITNAVGSTTLVFGPNKGDMEDLFLYGTLLIMLFIFSLVILFLSRKKTYFEK